MRKNARQMSPTWTILDPIWIPSWYQNPTKVYETNIIILSCFLKAAGEREWEEIKSNIGAKMELKMFGAGLRSESCESVILSNCTTCLLDF